MAIISYRDFGLSREKRSWDRCENRVSISNFNLQSFFHNPNLTGSGIGVMECWSNAKSESSIQIQERVVRFEMGMFPLPS